MILLYITIYALLTAFFLWLLTEITFYPWKKRIEKIIKQVEKNDKR